MHLYVSNGLITIIVVVVSFYRGVGRGAGGDSPLQLLILSKL